MVRGGLNGGDQEVAAGGGGELREKKKPYLFNCTHTFTFHAREAGLRGGADRTRLPRAKNFQTESDQGSGILRFYCKKFEKKNEIIPLTQQQRKEKKGTN